jgi:hypothetical protein
MRKPVDTTFVTLPRWESMAESWRSGAAKALGRQNAALVEGGR